MNPPFQYFGGKRNIAHDAWRWLGTPKQYIEPFCGSLAVLLAAQRPASLEVVNDANGFIANFWRAVVYNATAVAHWADYPVSHVDLGARHRWLMQQRAGIADGLSDPDWPGDPKAAGWWLWGQCCWIGSGWCEWERAVPEGMGQIPQVSNAGGGVQAIGAIGPNPAGGFWTSGGETAMRWLKQIAARIERVRVIHGDWKRCLNHYYGGDDTAIFFDPPYDGYGEVYGSAAVAQDVAQWCRENQSIRIALCGHIGDYDMPGWHITQWERNGFTYGGGDTKDKEAIWYSPACAVPGGQAVLL